ncbi:MAG: glycosyltransferase family 4 protein [Sedimentisphaerales bacterium]
MRILIIVQNYPPERGAVRYTRDLAVAMAAKGHDVSVITGLPHYPSNVPYEGYGRFKSVIIKEDGVMVIRTPLVMGSNRQKLRRIAGFLTFGLSSLSKAFFISRPDVIIASVPPLTVAPTGLVVSRVHRVPLVMLLRDVEPVCTMELRGLIDTPLARQIIGFSMYIYNCADKIVVTHNSQFDALTKYGIPGDKIKTITHGIDVGQFLKQAENPVPFSLPRRKGRFIALYLGTIGAAQNIQSLVRAFADQRVSNLPVDLVIIGDGEYALECQSLVKDNGLENVKILPPIPLEWVPAILAQADILTCTTYIAGVIGCKFYEYLASGKPLLVFGVGAGAELVKVIGNGWVCTPCDGKSLSQILSKFLADPDSAYRMGLRGCHFAEKNFDAFSNYERWDQLLHSLLRKA